MRFTRFLLLSAILSACSNDTFTGDDSGSDTGTDVTVSGGGDGGDASHDVTTVPLRYCQTVDAQFCADFDTPGDAGAGFEPFATTGSWTFAFQDAQAKSPPLAVEVDTLAANYPGAAFVQNPLLAGNTTATGPGTRLVVEADVYLQSPPGFTPDPVFVLRAGIIPAPDFSFGLSAHAGVWKLSHYNFGSNLNPQPPANKWVHVILAIDINPNAGDVTLDIPDCNCHADLNTFPTGVDGGPPTYPGYIAVGPENMKPTQSNLTFYVDNVLARWQ